jgi:hypothetical protein
MRKCRAAQLQVVSAAELDWTPNSDWWLIDATEAHSPFPNRDAAVAPSLKPKGTFGYGNVAPDLTALFPKGGSRSKPT